MHNETFRAQSSAGLEASASPRPDGPVKLLGLAAAGADLAFEVDRSGSIAFALGAIEQIFGCREADIVGADWCSLVADGDVPMLKSLLAGLEPGARQGPLRVSLRPKRAGALTRLASLSVFRAPENPAALSCALSLGAPSQFSDLPRNARGLLDRATFEEASASVIAQAHAAGQAVTLGFVQLHGLDAKAAQLDPAPAEAARQQIAAALRLASYAGMGATEIASERYALILAPGASPDRLAAQLSRAFGDDIMPMTADLRISGVPAQSLRAVRFALDRYAETDALEAATDFDAMLRHTAQSTARFRSVLAAGAFDLWYQPVVDLEHGAAHHYEALARFERGESPFPTIRLAEETGGIIDLDLMVVQKVLRTLEAYPKDCRIAVNISAASLMAPRSMDVLMAMTAEHGVLRSRLMFEITESQRLNDLEQANRIIAKVRRTGHSVCLDDFGATGASLDALCRLEVDYVKIDGRYIRTLDAGSRDATIVKHVVALCREFGVAAIAEMVETAEAAGVIGAFGVNLAQGWLYGRAAPKPEWSAARLTPSSRAATAA
jgi:EAL domain-containing protein (putative c-di-GMP-specific phosphodiesterase class I)